MPKKATKKQTVAQPAGKKGKKAPAKAPPPEESSSEEDDSSEEEEQVVQVKTKKAMPAKPVKKTESSDEDTSEEEDDDDAVPETNGTKVVAADDDDSSDDDEEAEQPAKGKGATKRKGTVAPVLVSKKQKVIAKEESEEDEDSDDDDDSEEDDEDQSAKANKRKMTKQAAKEPAKKKQKAKDEDSDDEDEEEDSDDEEGSDDEDQPAEKAKPAAKKQKLNDSQTDVEETITLFIGGLAADSTEEEVQEFLSENGIEVSSVRKPPKKRNAFVDLQDSNDLDKALALSGSSYNGSDITVDKAKPRQPRNDQQQFGGNKSFNSSFGGNEDDRDSRTLFVKGLPDDVTQDSLGTVFESASDIRIPQKDGYPKGFAFVEFSDASAMEEAMTEKQGAKLSGRSLYLDYMGSKSNFKANRGDRGGRGDRRGGRGFGDRSFNDRHSNSGARGETKVLFIKNLSYDTDESSLRGVFEGALSARIPTFPDSGKSKGFAFVEFGSPDEAASAYDTMAGETIDGRQVRIDFAAEKSGGGGGGGGGRGGRDFGRGFGRGRGRGGDRGRGRGGSRGGFNKARGGIVQGEGKKKTFDDSD
ncbi:nucleolin isoform X2 [Aplysia californica]|uniref:Nucleolin isoform X2 n=1 Tax=Aplysia californica TaxID=6500 RepID=A0ABM1A008_APLCA|nr:nucleolin isoform X2 [Aplysia californica]